MTFNSRNIMLDSLFTLKLWNCKNDDLMLTKIQLLLEKVLRVIYYHLFSIMRKTLRNGKNNIIKWGTCMCMFLQIQVIIDFQKVR